MKREFLIISFNQEILWSPHSWVGYMKAVGLFFQNGVGALILLGALQLA